MHRLDNKVAIVTGAAQGIGAAFARGLAAEGAKIVIADVGDGTDVANSIVRANGSAIYVKTDVSSPEQVKAIGAKVYQTALEPFKFPEAVLINGGGKGYGEVGFKLDASQRGYVQVDNRLFKRLFGDFAPSRGDLVLSKTGELLGIMVNSDYCALVNNFLPSKTITTGDNVKAQQTSQILNDVIARFQGLPFKLQ